jgi:hypothetical protein
MKFKKLLAISAVALAAHSQMAHAQWSNIDESQLTNSNMEMPIESEPKPFSYDTINVKAKMDMPLASETKPFSYNDGGSMPMESKEETSNKISGVLEKMRNNSTSNTNKFKY